MDLNQLHFAYPLYLWAGLIIPLIGILFFLFYRSYHSLHLLKKFIDSHLLPYLLVNHAEKKNFFWKSLLLWSIVWTCLTLALAGPRWSFREMETFSQDQSLVILLDLSESMNATDSKPSRLIRAKQKIEDLLNLAKGVKIGLIAFAADAHMLTPITEDKETIRHLLSSLETNLVYVQGSRLSPALDMASTLLEAEPGNNKALLVISDGGFEDASAIITAKKLAEKGVVIHVMGVGTIEGVSLHHEGNSTKKNKAPIFSRLEKERLNEISQVGNGRYLEAHYSDHEEAVILKELKKRADAPLMRGKKNRFWDERFYLMILPTLPIFLWWFRRRSLFIILLIFFISPFRIEAINVSAYFKNSEERGQQALEEGDYETAIYQFQDAYRKGIACYKAKNFVEAEKLFHQSSRENVACQALYNLGNTLVQQQKLQEAVAVYEDVLKKCPDHIKAKENLELVKKMLEQQKQKDSSSDNANSQKDQQSEKSENESKDEKQESKESTSQEQSQENEQPQNAKDSADEQKQQQVMKEKQETQNEKKEAQENTLERPEEQQGTQEVESHLNTEREEKILKSQEDQDADLWLNQIENDPKNFLKNKFYIESKKNGTKEGIDPW